MGYIALYWGVLVIGYFIGSKNRDKKEKLAFADNMVVVCVSCLVLLMGVRMGSNEEVINNLGTIGLKALAITVLLVGGAMAAVTAARKLLKMDRYGLMKSQTIPEKTAADEGYLSMEEEEASPDSSDLMMKLIIICVAVGLVLGYFIVRVKIADMDGFNATTGNIMTAILTVMLFLIGLGMGLTGTVVKHMKSVGFRVLVFPLAVVIGTTVMALVVSLIFSDLSPKESLAIGYGFGWYTFAPVSISNAGYEIAGAISFMHNVFRELGGMILIPVVAKRIGYIESTAMAGVAGMDICIPIVEKSCRTDIIVYSFTIGMFESLMVPLLVPLIIGL